MSTLFTQQYTGVQKVISGGQSGVDMVGLVVARSLGIPTGGTAAHGYIQDIDGIKQPVYDLRDIYGLTEGQVLRRQGKYGLYSDIYYMRTIKNVHDATGTVWFGNEHSPGGKLTIGTCDKHGIPYIINPTAEKLSAWLVDNSIIDLNVAGNREYTNPGISATATRILTEALIKNRQLNTIV